MLRSLQLRRHIYIASAFILLLASMIPLINQQTALAAYTLMGNREIRLSSSEPSATGLSYRVKFQPGTTGAINGVVVTFCELSPIIEDTTCNHPDGFNLSGAGVANQSTGAADGEGDSTLDATGLTTVATDAQSTDLPGQDNTFILTGTSTAANNTDYLEFDITGITNPSATGTFYARIYTYANAAGATGYLLSDPSDGAPVVDAGGVAISTAAQITVTAKVQERLTFCVYTAANCGLGGTSVTLGDVNGVLDPTVQYTDNSTKFDLTSNAVGSVSVRMKGDTLKRTPGCPDGPGQGCSIDPMGGANLAPNGGDGSSEEFGMRVTGGGGTLAGAAPYAAAGYAFDDTATNTTYGDEIATMDAGASETATIEFVGNITNTTEAGIYTTTLTFIATGTY